MSKRTANSPPEAEKSKDSMDKPTPITPPPPNFLSSYAQRLNAAEGSDMAREKRWHIPMTDREKHAKWDLVYSRRKKQHSTGRTPDNSPSKTISPPGSPTGEQRGNARRNASGPNSDFNHKHTEPKFHSRDEGSFRDEVEIEIKSINDKPFKGNITRREAKHVIFKDILGFQFDNFRGVRCGFKGVPIITLMMNSVFNMDDLASREFFTFERKYEKQGQAVTDVIGCKIRDVRHVHGSSEESNRSDDWTRIVKIEGCDYKVKPEVILGALSHYGEILTDMVEDTFEDEEDSEGTNATGIYSIKMRLEKHIPQLLPLDGRRIKIYYRSIKKLCTNCFGKHPRKDCQNQKMAWIDYVRMFVCDNPDFESDLFGRWNEILKREGAKSEESSRTTKEQEVITNELSVETQAPTDQTQPKETSKPASSTTNDNDCNVNFPTMGYEPNNPDQDNIGKPTLKEFNVPETSEEWDSVIESLVNLGLTYTEATINLEKRKKAFTSAMSKFDRTLTKRAAARGRNPGGRRTSK